MSVKVMGDVWGIEVKNSTVKLVLLAYADHADHEGGNIYPSTGAIAKKTGLSRRSVQRATKELVDEGILIPEGQHEKYQTNVYRYNWNYRGDRESPHDTSVGQTGMDVIDVAEGVTPKTLRSDRESPEPSLTIIKPSIKDFKKQVLKKQVPKDSLSLAKYEREILKFWGNMFPHKTLPNEGTYRPKIKTRMKSSNWMNNFHAAIEKAERSHHLTTSGWFQFEWLVRNDHNIFGILEGKFDGFDREHKQDDFDGIQEWLDDE